MRGHHLEAWLTMLEEKPHSRRACSLSSATRWPGSTSKPFREVRRSAPQRASSRFPPRAGALHIHSERIWEPHPGSGLPHSSVLQRGRLRCPAKQVRAEAAAAR